MLNLLKSDSFQVVVIHTFIIHVIMLQGLEKTINMFVKTELQIFQRILSPDYTEDSESQKTKEDMLDSEEGEQGKSSRETLLNITLHFLKRMKKDELADSLQSSKRLNII